MGLTGKTAKKGILSGIGTLLGGPIGGLVGSLGSSLLGNRGAKRRQQLADQQNIKFWNMQNAYNTPKAQMGRLQDAGLNPNLIYGSNANTGTAGSVSPSKASPYNVQNPVPSAIQSALVGAQIRNLNSISDKNNAETLLKGTQNVKSTQEIKLLGEQLIQSAVKSGQIKPQEQAKTKSLIAKAQIDVQNEGYNKAYTKFKSGLLNMGVDPTGAIFNTLIKFFANMFSDKNNSFFTNPQETNR